MYKIPAEVLRTLMVDARASSKRGASPLEVTTRFVELACDHAYQAGLRDGGAGADPSLLIAALCTPGAALAPRPLEGSGGDIALVEVAKTKRRRRDAIPPRNAEGEFEIPDDPDDLDVFLNAKDES